jgi:Flp pilus assembly pilin Flp
MSKRGESGQVLVEYLLGIVAAVALILILRNGLMASIGKLWTALAGEISAACPKGCLANPTITNVFRK